MRPIFIRFEGRLIDIAKVSYISTCGNRLYIRFLQQTHLAIEYDDETDCAYGYNYLMNLFETNGLLLR